MHDPTWAFSLDDWEVYVTKDRRDRLPISYFLSRFGNEAAKAKAVEDRHWSRIRREISSPIFRQKRTETMFFDHNVTRHNDNTGQQDFGNIDKTYCLCYSLLWSFPVLYAIFKKS